MVMRRVVHQLSFEATLICLSRSYSKTFFSHCVRLLRIVRRALFVGIVSSAGGGRNPLCNKKWAFDVMREPEA